MSPETEGPAALPAPEGPLTQPGGEHMPDQALAYAELQARYRTEYLVQLRRLSCPGCGEEPFA